MLNKENQLLCNFCNNIVCDGKTLLPGYLSVSDRVIMEYSSIDPNNNLNRLDVMKNRLEGNGQSFIVSKIVRFPDVNLEDLKNGDYCNTACLSSFINKS